MSENSKNIVESVKDNLSNQILSTKEFRGETTFYIDRSNVLDVCSILKNDFGFKFLADLTAVDYLEVKSPRFEVIYYLHRFGDHYGDNTRIRLKVEVLSDDLSIASVTPIWKGADWLEREVYDMFGIKFHGHPDLRRILMPEDYDEFPLRKDFNVRDRESSKKSFQKALREGNF